MGASDCRRDDPADPWSGRSAREGWRCAPRHRRPAPPPARPHRVVPSASMVSSHPNDRCRDLTTGVYGRRRAPSSGPQPWHRVRDSGRDPAQTRDAVARPSAGARRRTRAEGWVARCAIAIDTRRARGVFYGPKLRRAAMRETDLSLDGPRSAARRSRLMRPHGWWICRRACTYPSSATSRRTLAHAYRGVDAQRDVQSRGVSGAASRCPLVALSWE